jgi:hypothetical protein
MCGLGVVGGWVGGQMSVNARLRIHIHFVASGTNDSLTLPMVLGGCEAFLRGSILPSVLV